MNCVGLSPGAENRAEFSTFFLPNFLTLGLFSHSHLFPFLLFFPSMDSSGLNPFPEDRILSHWVSFSLSPPLKMTILEYFVAFVVAKGQILPLPLLWEFQRHELRFYLHLVSRGEKDEEAQNGVAASPKTP